MIETAKLLDFTKSAAGHTFKMRAPDGSFYQAIQGFKREGDLL